MHSANQSRKAFCKELKLKPYADLLFMPRIHELAQME